MKLVVPELKKRSDNSKPMINSLLGNFENNFSIFKNTISFHFFTDASNNVKEFAWRVLISNTPIIENEIENEIYHVESREKIISYIKFLKQYDLKLQYIIFNDSDNWKIGNNYIFLCEFILNESDNLAFSKIKKTQIEFESLIRTIQGGDMIMNKPLSYSTTEFEGYLADLCQSTNPTKGKAIFPGDVDLVIYNDNCKRVIEFKKHTKYGNGDLEDQSFMNYIADRKKYNALASLTKKFKLDYFVNLIYSTRDNELDLIKIEYISPDLKLLRSHIFNFTDRIHFQKLLEYIFYYK